MGLKNLAIFAFSTLMFMYSCEYECFESSVSEICTMHEITAVIYLMVKVIGEWKFKQTQRLRKYFNKRREQHLYHKDFNVSISFKGEHVTKYVQVAKCTFIEAKIT